MLYAILKYYIYTFFLSQSIEGLAYRGAINEITEVHPVGHVHCDVDININNLPLFILKIYRSNERTFYVQVMQSHSRIRIWNDFLKLQIESDFKHLKMTFILACTTWSTTTSSLITDISQDEALVQSFQDFIEITPVLIWTADQLSGEKITFCHTGKLPFN